MTSITSKRAFVALLFAITMFLARPSSGDEPPAGYQIGAGDVLEIAVWKNNELSREVTVRPDGMISLPLVNDVHAAGLTPTELRELLTKKLSEYVPSAEVSVIVKRVESYSVSVVGSVSHPGRFVLSSPTTALEAIAMAGGLNEFASRRSITVLEKGARRAFPSTTTTPLQGRRATIWCCERVTSSSYRRRANQTLWLPSIKTRASTAWSGCGIGENGRRSSSP
jgi:polysaccharide biosynthesis/export protein